MQGLRRSALTLGLLISCVFPIYSALAGETVNYSYDAGGRLIKVSRSGTVNNGVSTCHAYDKADNRSSVTVATSDCSVTPPSFAVGDASVTEGTSLVFTVTKAGTTSSSFSVNYATSNGTATAGSDYTSTSGTLTFLANESSKTVSVPTTDDASVESAETLTLTLSGATGGATISDATGAGTINDNDSSGPPSFAISDAYGIETGTLVFTVTKTGSTSSSFSVNYATANGTATSTSDYFAASGTLTFASNETSKTITVSTRDNAIFEATESLYVNLSGATGGATISDTQGVGSIDDNDEETCPPEGCP